MANNNPRGVGRIFRYRHHLRTTRVHQDEDIGIDPHFHTCKKFVSNKAFVQEAVKSMINGELAYFPSCGSLDMDRVQKNVANYYIHKFNPNMDYLYECQHNIDSKFEKVTKLQDACYAVVMNAFADRFEALHEKYKDILDAEQGSTQTTQASDNSYDNVTSANDKTV